MSPAKKYCSVQFTFKFPMKQPSLVSSGQVTYSQAACVMGLGGWRGYIS